MKIITAIVTAIPIPIPPPVETPSGRAVDVALEEVREKGVDVTIEDGEFASVVTDTNAVRVVGRLFDSIAGVVVAITRDVEVPFITVTDSSGVGPPEMMLN